MMSRRVAALHSSNHLTPETCQQFLRCASVLLLGCKRPTGAPRKNAFAICPNFRSLVAMPVPATFAHLLAPPKISGQQLPSRSLPRTRGAGSAPWLTKHQRKQTCRHQTPLCLRPSSWRSRNPQRNRQCLDALERPSAVREAVAPRRRPTTIYPDHWLAVKMACPQLDFETSLCSRSWMLSGNYSTYSS
jgi:hypothetical protein